MTLRPKADVSQTRKHLAELKAASWLGSDRRWWPDYLFHCTDIRNAVSILRHGEMLSRAQATASGTLQVDIGSQQIIAQTEPEWQDYVRLYFRPRTPTQYSNEGFRPRDQIQYGAHCPVPVYFLLDSGSILARDDCLFTDGNVAADAEPRNSIDEFKQLPFQLIYHDTWFDPDQRGKIVYHRNAEVLVPQRLDIAALRFVICRSQAEYETLVYLLPPGTLNRWADKIAVRPNLRLFFNKWTFVEQVEKSTDSLLFRFNRGTDSPGPFDARVEVVESATGRKYTWQNQHFQADNELSLRLHSVQNPQDYSARLSLDAQPAFAGRYQLEELPF